MDYTLQYPEKYIWLHWDGYGYRADIIGEGKSFHMEKVPEEYHSLPVIKNLWYIPEPKWANVVHTENTQSTSFQSQQRKQS